MTRDKFKTKIGECLKQAYEAALADVPRVIESGAIEYTEENGWVAAKAVAAHLLEREAARLTPRCSDKDFKEHKKNISYFV